GRRWDEPLVVVPRKDIFPLPEGVSVQISWYNSLVLASKNMFAADLDGKGGLAELEKLHLIDRMTGADFSAQTYRIYRTRKGHRVICTSTPLPWGGKAEALLEYLGSDQSYTRMCGEQRGYRMRLTPKYWRGDSKLNHVCDLLATVGPVDHVHPDLA